MSGPGRGCLSFVIPTHSVSPRWRALRTSWWFGRRHRFFKIARDNSARWVHAEMSPSSVRRMCRLKSGTFAFSRDMFRTVPAWGGFTVPSRLTACLASVMRLMTTPFGPNVYLLGLLVNGVGLRLGGDSTPRRVINL